MNRHLISSLVVSAFALFSCATEPCGCPPAITRLVVVGTVGQADEAPVAGAAVAVGEAQLPCPPDGELGEDFPLIGEATTDDAGAFLTELLSGFGPGERCVLVRAVAGSDTALVGRVAEFRLDGEPDTLAVAITLGGEGSTVTIRLVLSRTTQ